MKVAELLCKKPRGIFTEDVLLRGDLIALDSKSGKILFDTRKNKREYIEQYLNGEIDAIWADVVQVKSFGYGDYFKPIMKCFVIHNSWIEKESD